MIRPHATHIANRVFIKRAPAETTSRGGIHIPDTAQKKPTEGVVAFVGPGRWLEDGSRVPPCVSPGDRVLFEAYRGIETMVEGEHYIIMIEQELDAVLEA